MHTDDTYLPAVRTDIVNRRGEIKQLLTKNNERILVSLTPLAELVGYSTVLRTMTSGTATFDMELNHYCQLTADEQHKVLSSTSY